MQFKYRRIYHFHENILPKHFGCYKTWQGSKDYNAAYSLNKIELPFIYESYFWKLLIQESPVDNGAYFIKLLNQ